MDSAYRGNGSGDDNDLDISSSRRGKKHYHRHTSQQIQQLEAFFKDCPHPDENQRRQLSRELGLEPKQIKFWFQNKRTQTKAQGERADNSALRTENERIHCENLAMREALKNVVCLQCDGPALGEEERKRGLQILRMENAQLKEEHERLSAVISNLMGRSSMMAAQASSGVLHEESNNYLVAGGSAPVDPRNNNNNNPVVVSQPLFTLGGGVQEMEKSAMVDTMAIAMEELIELLQADEPLWIRTPEDGRLVLHRETYDRVFPKVNYLRSVSTRTESSKDSAVVSASPVELIEMCLDPSKWMDFFPTIVAKARIIEVLDSGMLGGSLQLMFEKMHILSPMVAPRDFIFLRYCRQLDATAWIMVNVSYDCFKENEGFAPSYYWKLPSGCLIQDLHNGKSKVTWIEHVQVDDKTQTHRLYRDLICGSQAYGANRWIVTLQRMCERYGFSMGVKGAPTARHELEEVMNEPQGRRSVMQLSQRMVKSFCEILNMGERVDFPQTSEMNNSGVRISLRKSSTETAQSADALVVCAASSLWLPLPSDHLFNFFRDDQLRAQWDVLSNGYPVTEVARIPTGNHPGNCVSIFQPYVSKESSMLVLQESCVNSLEGHVVYAPIDLPVITASINGEDPIKIPMLPSGFVISGDGRLEKKSSTAQSSNSKMGQGGSLLTVAFQILISNGSLSKQVNMECVATVHALISSTIQKIKTALDCSDLE
nr:homeobox-leucine zipper protein ROC8-like [Ipomoea batatas]